MNWADGTRSLRKIPWNACTLVWRYPRNKIKLHNYEQCNTLAAVYNNNPNINMTLILICTPQPLYWDEVYICPLSLFWLLTPGIAFKHDYSKGELTANTKNLQRNTAYKPWHITGMTHTQIPTLSQMSVHTKIGCGFGRCVKAKSFHLVCHEYAYTLLWC
jgi:hypothetical protein